MKLEVYKITNNKNGKIYVGITNQGVAVRWSKHCSDANCNSTFPLHNAIRKYGKDNFQIELIEEVDDVEVLKEREIYWIKTLDSYNRLKGYNLTFGGDGTFGRFHSEETKDKIRQKAINRKCSISTRKNMSNAQKLVKRNYSKLASLSNSKRWANEENHIKHSITNVNNKPILQYTLTGVFVKEFYNISEAARSLNKTHQNLGKCANGKLKTAYGYIWKYKDKP